MKVFLGADHRGFQLKKDVKKILEQLGHEVIDAGTDNETESCDYPLIAYKVAIQVKANPGSRGILLCLSGIGLTMAANKVPGILAALVYNKEAAVLSRRHNDSNVLVLGSEFVGKAQTPEIIKLWFSTAFEAGRHLRRKEQIQAIEKAAFLISQGKKAPEKL